MSGALLLASLCAGARRTAAALLGAAGNTGALAAHPPLTRGLHAKSRFYKTVNIKEAAGEARRPAPRRDRRAIIAAPLPAPPAPPS